MDYSGPDAADFAEVAALNQAFLVCLRAPAGARSVSYTHLTLPTMQ